MNARQLGKVLSPLAILLAALLSLDALERAVELLYGAAASREMGSTVLILKIAAMLLLCIWMGASPAWGRHPAVKPHYAAWLRATPWRPGLPLPLGAAALTLTELLRLAGVVAVTKFYLGWPIAAPLLAVALVYTAAAAVVLVVVAPRWVAVALAAGVGLLVRAVPNLWLVYAIAGTLYLLAWWGLHRSLRGFPWGMDEATPPRWGLGFVVDRLGPRPLREKISTSSGVVLAALIGWGSYCVLAHFPLENPDARAELLRWVMGVGVFGALARVAVYCLWHWPPISFLGRVFHGPLIVPRYDYVLLTPAAAMVTAAGLPRLLLTFCSPAAAEGLSLTAVLVVLLIGPPSLPTWQLTGHHRMIETNPAAPAQRERKPLFVTTP